MTSQRKCAKIIKTTVSNSKCPVRKKVKLPAETRDCLHFAHVACLCPSYDSHQKTAIIFLHSINRMVFTMDTKCAFCEARIEFYVPEISVNVIL